MLSSQVEVVAVVALSALDHMFRRVERGDVIALPKGTIYWWYNCGKEVHRVLCAADISSLASLHPSHYNVRRRRPPLFSF